VQDVSPRYFVYAPFSRLHSRRILESIFKRSIAICYVQRCIRWVIALACIWETLARWLPRPHTAAAVFTTGNPRVWWRSSEEIILAFCAITNEPVGLPTWTSLHVMVPKKNPDKISLNVARSCPPLSHQNRGLKPRV